MVLAWQEDPERRPEFVDITRALVKMLGLADDEVQSEGVIN
jgi:hypothetical protein